MRNPDFKWELDNKSADSFIKKSMPNPCQNKSC
jgi:hypothetical protein